MATRSGIGIERDDGSVVGVYAHWDGYPEGVGKILQEHYREPVKVESLVALGSISSLDQDIGEKHPFNERREGWTTFHGRDRGETGVEPRTFPSREEFRAGLRNSGIEFFYVGSSAEPDGEIRWEVSKPFGPWRNVGDVLVRGVDILVEQEQDRGADILVERESPVASVVLLRGVTGPGKDWLEEHVDPDAPVFAGRIAAETRFALAIVDGARRDGLVVEESSPDRPAPQPVPQSPDLIVERREIDGSPVLVVLARTKAGSDWMDRNRHPDVPKADPVRSICHPKALPMLLGARDDGLVVVVEGEDAE